MSIILQKYNILIFDPDAKMAGVLKLTLEGMGFSNIRIITEEDKVFAALQSEPADFMITEWSAPKVMGTNGLDLLTRIRKDPTSPNPALPVIMLTGRAENSDVLTARNFGITEYVVKPFSAHSLYTRIERLVEQPRSFVVSPNFVGPDRRTQKPLPEGVSDRRTAKPAIQPENASITKAVNDNDGVHIWPADYSLKKKLGMNTPLSSVITPNALNRAQATIEAIASESLSWIRENLFELKAMQKSMMQGDYGHHHTLHMGELALLISARSGTFGYKNAAQIAYMLYIFCHNRLDPEKPLHCVIAEKHIDVLQVTLSDNVRNQLGAQDEEIIFELQNLATKYGT